MKTRHALHLAFWGIRSRPSRTFLTLLGIAIGIMAVMLIMSLGNGASRLITDEISGLGADVIAVQAGKETNSINDISTTLLSDSLKRRDLDALRKKANVPHMIDAQPITMYVGAATYDNQIVSAPQIIGGNAVFFADMFDLTAQEGVFFGDDEIKDKEQIAVIGSKVKQELFGDASALGESITIKDRKFRVAGVIASAGQVAFANVDDMILIPYTAVQTYLLGEERFFEFIVRVDDPKNVPASERDIIATLRDTHDLKPGDDNDFKVRTPAALIQQVSSILLTLTIFLVSVVGVALLVGGIGIMNIMLVSVTERTREIGLRKAVGATNFDIRLQFLLEALLLTLLGGLAGVVTGGLFSLIAGILIRTFTSLNWVISFPLAGIVLSFGFSALIGISFGLYPANLAAKKSPMEALRYE